MRFLALGERNTRDKKIGEKRKRKRVEIKH